MSRYKDTLVKTDKESGYRVYGLTIYPSIPIQDGDQFIYPYDGEKLEGLAFKYYQDTSFRIFTYKIFIHNIKFLVKFTL